MFPDDPALQRQVIRERPGMYIGDVFDGSGLIHMVWEVLDNALDEHIAGHCSKIEVVIDSDGAVQVSDDGRGISLAEFHGEPFAQAALTRMHDSATLDGHAPHDNLGPRGLGLFVVNVLSARLALRVRRDGGLFTQRYVRGQAVTPLERVGASSETGTSIVFLPDAEIFLDPWINPGPIALRMRELAWLNSKLELTFTDRRCLRFSEPSGLQRFLGRHRGHGGPTIGSRLYAHVTEGAIQVEVAAEWVHASWSQSVQSFANSTRTTGDSTHVEGLFSGLIAGMRAALPDACRRILAKRLRAAIADGMHGVVCVRLEGPTFDNPTRTRLHTPEATSAVAVVVKNAFAELLMKEPTLAALFVERLAKAKAG